MGSSVSLSWVTFSLVMLSPSPSSLLALIFQPFAGSPPNASQASGSYISSVADSIFSSRSCPATILQLNSSFWSGTMAACHLLASRLVTMESTGLRRLGASVA
ncbi:hypothetical protein BDY17DRAFT_306391 [Neohortaea acidophila]|uniref:Secreted protein n=1 Tax=Neohortaea acidophila TaxID=245834 RepID=A0A6A6PET5_9PEZI|nr:uncharacterized protein BDY17DRAFT_306391 [Neohortaea acidophila]KAF2478430.1 hypothetical protein BDY17DRAFT_306391 [Neohortaea acidophila]